ncbi:MAG: proton-conducting transporter membrane subunit, partial [Janthinobacterium lividum]
MGAALILVTCSINIYAISRDRKLEVIVGGLYLGFSLVALFSYDFISAFIALELMMISATIIIFIGKQESSIASAKSYLFTHLFSGSLILVGISYIFTTSNSIQMINLVHMIDQPQYSNIFYYLLLLGCLINVAAFPFSSWVINCYPSASSSGFIYLNLFTTKISIILIIKLFWGLGLLKYFGAAMIVYGNIYACIEDNNRRVSCYLAISQLGLILIGISIGTKLSILGVISYLVVYITYKSLLALVFAVLLDEGAIENCSQLKIIKSLPSNISIWVSFLTMLNLPVSITFVSKAFLYNDLEHNAIKYLIQVTSIIIFLSLPFKKLLYNKQSIQIKTNKYIFVSLALLVSILVVSNYCIIYNYQFLSKSRIVTDFSDKIVKQAITIIIGIALAIFISLPRIDSRKFNIDILVMSAQAVKFFYSLYLRIISIL